MSSSSQVIWHPSFQVLISLHPSVVLSLGSLSHNSTVTQVFTNISSPLLYESIHLYSSYSRKESSPMNAQSIDLINILALVGKCSSGLYLSPNDSSLLETLWEGIRAPVRKIQGLENVSSSVLDTPHSRFPWKSFLTSQKAWGKRFRCQERSTWVNLSYRPHPNHTIISQ